MTKTAGDPPARAPEPKRCENFSPPGWGRHWRDWHEGHGCHLDPWAAETKSWAVTVERNGEQVVTLSSDMLAGRDLSAEDARIIRRAARHLLSFAGEGDD